MDLRGDKLSRVFVAWFFSSQGRKESCGVYRFGFPRRQSASCRDGFVTMPDIVQQAAAYMTGPT